MDFIDRNEELARLRHLTATQASGLAVLYGRRRIGKSWLLVKWCQECKGIYWVADTSAPALQRLSLAEAISARFPGFGEVIYPTWSSLLNALSQRARMESWHGPVIFDEFPYLVAADHTLPGVFQAWIDAEIRDQGLLAVISGSSQNMMQGLTLCADAPLYGRAQEVFLLKPLAAGHISRALHLKAAVPSIQAYSVWGGVPRYWQAAEQYGNHLEQCLDELVFHPLGVFHDEPNFLLHSETPNAIGLRPYLEVIGYGAHRISEMGARLQQPATALARPLSRLVELGLVQRQVPFGEDERTSKKSLYTIGDPFCYFWFHVIAPRRSLFENATQEARLLLWRRYAHAIFAYQWEELVRNTLHRVDRLCQSLSPNDVWLPARRWWQENYPEWDAIMANLAGDQHLLAEVKWSERPFKTADLHSLTKELLQRELPACIRGKATAFTLVVPSVEAHVPDTINGVIILTGRDILNATLGY
ncbi:MAG: ATP-binding protein [Victivallales bacterium]|nr:ATP-binding protein [Victivallales bacterium]